MGNIIDDKIEEMRLVGTVERYREVKCENPLKGIWDNFLKLRDISFLEDNWEKGNFDDNVFISTSIVQAHEYFKASQNSSLKTSPLLLYYSFLNLTKAVLFILNEEEPSGFHGLCNVETKDSLLNCSAKTNNGVFNLLAGIFNYDLKLHEKLHFSHFCENAIEIAPIFSDYFDRKPKIIKAQVKVLFNGTIKVRIPEDIIGQLEKNTDFMKDFKIKDNPEYLNMVVLENKEKVEINNGRIKDEDFEIISEHFNFSLFPDGNYYININAPERRMPSALAYFGMLYILGDIVRYSPRSIYNFIDDTSSIEWFINKLIDVSSRIYPNILFNRLYNTRIKFVSY